MYKTAFSTLVNGVTTQQKQQISKGNIAQQYTKIYAWFPAFRIRTVNRRRCEST